MKKITFLLAAMLFITTVETNAQDASRECTIKYNLFKGDFQSKKFDDAYSNWIFLMDNCKDLSVNIYKFGATLSEEVRKDPVLEEFMTKGCNIFLLKIQLKFIVTMQPICLKIN
jgi:hypothetical protein